MISSYARNAALRIIVIATKSETDALLRSATKRALSGSPKDAVPTLHLNPSEMSFRHPAITAGTPPVQNRTYAETAAAETVTRLFTALTVRLRFSETSELPITVTRFTVGNGEGAISDGELIEDIPVGDLKKFIGTSWYYYIPQFLYFARNLKKASINLTAFITHGLWFISRKMYLIGFSLMLVMTATNLFRTYVECRMYPEGISNYSDALADTTVFMTEHPLLVFGMMVCTAIQIAVIFFSGVFGNRMYMSHCIRKTRRLNSECTSAEQFNKRLTEAGGISVIPTISCAAVYFLITYYSSYFIYTHILG